MPDPTRGKKKKQWWERPDPETAESPAEIVPPPAPAPFEPAEPVEPAKKDTSRHRLTEEDVYLFHEGTHYRVYEKLGAHPDEVDGVAGTRFAVWAPNAQEVSVIGDWNDWTKHLQRLAPHGNAGLWEGFLPGVRKGMRYKYHVVSRHRGYRADKADPYALCTEVPPRQASIVWELGYEWGDGAWMAER